MNNKNLQLINSLIEKTKQNSIHWQPLSTCPVNLKREKGHNLDSTIANMGVTAITTPSLVHSASYFFQHNDGYIFLLAYNSFVPVERMSVSLVIQTELSNNSVVYASTQDNDEKVISSLKRLYNIVDSYDYDIESFVNDFINE